MPKALYVLPVLALLGMFSTAHAQQDTTPPAHVGASLDPSTGILEIFFDETIDVSETDLGRIGAIYGVDADEIFLSGSTVDDTADSDTLAITLSQSLLSTIGDTIHCLFVYEGAVKDTGGNLNAPNDFCAPVTTLEARQIGVIVPTTGPIAGLGTVINGTIAYAVSEFNGYLADNGRDWRLATQVIDDAGDPNLSLAAVQSFDASGIKSFIGPITSSSLASIEFDVGANGMLAISYGSTAPALAKNDRIFRTITSDAGLGPALADRLVSDGITHVLPVYRDDVWGNALNDALHDSLSGTGIGVLPAISYNPNTPNPAPTVVGQIVSSVPLNEEFRSAVVLFSFEEITQFVDLAVDLEPPHARWYGTDTVVGALLEDEDRSSFLSDAEYTIATLNVEPNRVNRAIDEAVPGADVYSYAAYDAVFILGKAIDLVGSQSDTAALAAAMPGIAAAHASAVGDSTLNEFGDLKSGDYVYRTVVDGAFVDLDAPSGGSSGEHHKKPTFGMYELTHGQLVSCGYSMDGQCRDVLDYHVDYERETIQTGSVHDFTLKAYSPINHIAQFQIAFGIPAVGAPASEAEATIVVDLGRNYTLPSTYQVEGVSYLNDNGVIGEEAAVSVDLVRCMAGLEGDCVQLSIDGVLFREQMHHEPFAIYAMDRDRRTATHYMNEGMLVQGGSLNPAPQATAGIKKQGNQHAAEPIELVRVDKLGDLWEDQWGMTWTRNSFGTWHQLTQEPFERHSDVHWNVMDRTHSGFAALVQHEGDRAVLAWDSSEIQGVLGAPIAGDRGEPEVPRLERLAGMLASESLRAQAVMDQLTQGRAHHTGK